ncbi:tripartite tricarboxylate transporter TctB family protein [Pseudooceanicola sp. CBS1P-1]|uniref:DUF1468 domain-containing protein n=1 Tax=Pseudooceanicola albus TaxID=2692189 RepID=A0A6L7G8Y1_9RHOB|nr:MULTISPECIES: tripartite tricarboxylate transporter TctB family protein [Pseudooceanicola]MBT9384415.1 tripartite tricarboxylate transporter TctB family protein [Pseudooceanicola endophyticus]MXN20684.1 hypothetical protein [Pseudooceanicola albus]
MSGSSPQDRGAQGRLDFLIGALAVAGALLSVFWMIPAQIAPTADAGQLSPRFFPTLTATVVGLFGLAMMIRNRAWALRRVPHAGPRLLRETLAWTVWATATLLLLTYAGFIVTGALSCFAAMLLAGQRRHLLLCALGSILLAVAIQQLSWHAFYIQLP